MVPLYQVFCDLTGLNGKIVNAPAPVPTDLQPDVNRNVQVQFLAARNANMPWEFVPITKSIALHPGVVTEVAYYVKNPTQHAITAQAIPSVTPGEATPYLHKIECFCFSQQTLAAGEEQEMPVLFYVDTDLPEHIETLALGYTLFDIHHMEGVSEHTTSSHHTMH